MKKFKFSLESVLQIRRFEEDKVKHELAVINQKISEYERQIQYYYLLLERECNKSLAIFDFNFFEHRTIYLAKMQKLIQENKEKLAATLKEQHACQKKLGEAYKKTRTLENLKDKKYHEYLQEMDLIEQKLQDDLGLGGFIRQKMQDAQ